ncbi:hypothetical protein F2P56_024444, partial [Juglans regia]
VLKSLNVQAVITPNRRCKTITWNRPSAGWVKLNTDGSSLGNPGASGIGGIIRNNHGNLIHAFSSFIGIGSNNRAELLALLHGIQVCKSLSLNYVHIELDSMNVISWWKSKRCGVWYLEDFWEELIDIMDSMTYSINHVFREGNKVVDWLAKQGASGNDLAVSLLTESPRELRGLIRMDYSGLPSLRFR